MQLTLSQHLLVEIELPLALEQFRLPEGVNGRLQHLLTRQDQGESLTAHERKDLEGRWN